MTRTDIWRIHLFVVCNLQWYAMQFRQVADPKFKIPLSVPFNVSSICWLILFHRSTVFRHSGWHSKIYFCYYSIRCLFSHWKRFSSVKAKISWKSSNSASVWRCFECFVSLYEMILKLHELIKSSLLLQGKCLVLWKFPALICDEHSQFLKIMGLIVLFFAETSHRQNCANFLDL